MYNEAEAEVAIGGVRRDLAMSIVGRRGPVLGRVAAMILMNKSRGTWGDLHSHLGTGTWR